MSEALKLRPPFGIQGAGTAMVPRCLTGESEERETWTAESLRAVFARAEEILQRDAVGRDFGGYTFQGTPLIEKSIRVVDLVKVTIPNIVTQTL